MKPDNLAHDVPHGWEASSGFATVKQVSRRFLHHHLGSYRNAKQPGRAE